MALSDFLMSIFELGLSLLLLGLYLILGLTLTFLVLIGVGLILGEDKCNPSEQLETHGVCPNSHLLFIYRVWS